MSARSVRPAADEAASYYSTYINVVPDGDICETLEAEGARTVAFLRTIPPARAGHRYAPGKWSINEVLGHINDCERMFAFRAFWFARAFDSPLPSFDQDVAARHAGAEDRDLSSHIEEFATLRAASLDLFNPLPVDAWSRRGVASGNPFTVRALAFITAGHALHHVRILQERYL